MRGQKVLIPCMALAITSTLAFPAMVFAGLISYQQAYERPKGPSPDAFAACEGKQAGDTVIVVSHRGENIEAVCETLNSRLVARPKGLLPSKEGQ